MYYSSPPLRRLLLAACFCAVPFPAAGQTLFGLTDTGELFSSGDNGVSWSVLAALPVSDAVDLHAAESATELFMASETGTMFRSTDAGMTWDAVGSVTASDLVAMLIFSDRMLAFTETGTVYKSLDDGGTWTAVGAITASDLAGVSNLEANTYAVTRTGTVYASPDGGVTWTAVGAVTTSSAVDIAGLGASLFVLTSQGLVARSDDAGSTWIFVGTLSQTGMTSLLATDSELFAGHEAGHVWMSVDGASWAAEGSMNQLTMRALAHDIPAVIGVPENPPTPVLRFLPPTPNPARGTTDLVFDLEVPATVTVEVFNLSGRLVDRPLAGEPLAEGRSHRTWQPTGLARGAYYLRATLGSERFSRKLIWLGAN